MSSERASERLVSGGRVAKKPKEVGEESRMEAAERLTVRARWRAAGGEREWRVVPGAERERMAVEMLWVAMNCLVDSTDHWGVGQPDGSPPLSESARGVSGYFRMGFWVVPLVYSGGRKWW